MSAQHTASFSAMDAWFESALGQHLLACEKDFLASCLTRRFGYHLLQLGCAPIAMYDSSPIGHKFTLTTDSIKGLSDGLGLPDALPLQNESVDLVLLHHALDYSGYQHQLLREVSRVLIAGGHLLILGFNPHSSWGLRQRLSVHKHAPWNAQPLSPGRVCDWLQLLDFQVESRQHGVYCLPINSARGIRYARALEKMMTKLNWPVGAFYLISARKQVLPLIPVQEKWHKIPATLPLSVAENTGHGSCRQQRHLPSNRKL